MESVQGSARIDQRLASPRPAELLRLFRLPEALFLPSVRSAAQFKKVLMHSRVARQLRVKRCRQHAPLLHQNGPATILGNNLYARSGVLNDRRADEDHLQWPALPPAR